MAKILFVVTIFSIAVYGLWFFANGKDDVLSYTVEEKGFEEILPAETQIDFNGKYTLEKLERFERQPGAMRVGVQAGHWKNDEVPEELRGLERNGAGATGGGVREREVVLAIAELVVQKLKEKGIEADLLPATIPPGYLADAFVSVHADGNPSSAVSGFKIASPTRDYSKLSKVLEGLLYSEYQKTTNLKRDKNVTRRMRGYYAFNWRRYEHALHPMTPAAIVETGFVTSPKDRLIIVKNPNRAAEGIVKGILKFLELMPPQSW